MQFKQHKCYNSHLLHRGTRLSFINEQTSYNKYEILTSYNSVDDGTDRGRFERRNPYKSGWMTASCTTNTIWFKHECRTELTVGFTAEPKLKLLQEVTLNTEFIEQTCSEKLNKW